MSDMPLSNWTTTSAQYLRAFDDLFNCRLDVENEIFNSKDEEATEVLKATKLRKACVDGIYQLLDESVVVITSMNPQDPSTATIIVAETLSLHDDWVSSKLTEVQELCAKVKETMTNLASTKDLLRITLAL